MMFRALLLAAALYCVSGVSSQLVQPTAYRSIISAFAAYGVTVDWNRTVYLADQANGRIVMLNASGAYLNQIAASAPQTVAVDTGYGAIYYISNNDNTRPIRVYNGSAQYFGPSRYIISDIAVMQRNGYVVVAEANRMNIIGRDNRTVANWTFSYCLVSKIAVSSNELAVYACCSNSYTIYKCSITGSCNVFVAYTAFVKTMAVDEDTDELYISGATSDLINRYNRIGSLTRQIVSGMSAATHMAMAVDYVAGDIFLVPRGYAYVLHYAYSGVAMPQVIVTQFPSSVPAFFLPRSLAVDAKGTLYMYDNYNVARVLRFNADLRVLNQSASLGISLGGFLAADNLNNVYITDPSKYTVLRVNFDGNSSLSIVNTSFTLLTIAASTTEGFYVSAMSYGRLRILKYSWITRAYTDVTPSSDIIPLIGQPIIAVDRAQNVYLSTTSSTFVVQIDGAGQRRAYYSVEFLVYAIAVDSLGYVYVSSAAQSSPASSIIRVFRNDATLLSMFSAPSLGNVICSAIAVDSIRQMLYCADYSGTRLFALPLPPPVQPASSSSATPMSSASLRSSSMLTSSLRSSSRSEPSSSTASSAVSLPSSAPSSTSSLPRPPSPSSSSSLSSSSSVSAVSPATGGHVIGSFWSSFSIYFIVGAATLCCVVIVVASVLGCLIHRQRTQARSRQNKRYEAEVDMRVFIPPPPRQAYPIAAMQQQLIE